MMMPSIFRDNLFDEMMNFPFDDDFFGRKDMARKGSLKNMMSTDVRETDSGYEIAIDLPGYKKDEISADLTNGCLTVKAEREANNDTEENGSYIRRERYYGSCSRSFYVGEEIREEDIKARFEDGLLKLSVPKRDAKEVEESKRIAIEG
ncbi:MAG: Hsp20/alpha crystallin family protein [Lachnospiraceae bacterium]|nr:Hsp20/alpha crystallin family protein [Lachnospiraceae bacterium]